MKLPLGLDWQAIADLEEPEHQPPQSKAIPVIEESPFITGTPITHPRHFFGRERELKRCFNLLKHHPLRNIAIIGKRRTACTRPRPLWWFGQKAKMSWWQIQPMAPMEIWHWFLPMEWVERGWEELG